MIYVWSSMVGIAEIDEPPLVHLGDSQIRLRLLDGPSPAHENVGFNIGAPRVMYIQNRTCQIAQCQSLKCAVSSYKQPPTPI